MSASDGENQPEQPAKRLPPDPFGSGPSGDRIRAKAAELREKVDRQKALEAAYSGFFTTDLASTERPPWTPEMEKCRKQSGLFAACVIASEPGRPMTGVGFFLLSPRVPAAGEVIRLPDGRECEVKRVQHAVGAWGSTDGKPEALVSTPNVMAEFLPPAVELKPDDAGETTTEVG